MTLSINFGFGVYSTYIQIDFLANILYIGRLKIPTKKPERYGYR